jgi:endonuclease/exonuclease/phosphatase family metal-dependent hydrolase
VKRAAAFSLLLAACVSQEDVGGPWIDIATYDKAELGPRPAATDAPPCKLRIATWNLHLAPDPNDLARHIRASHEVSQADVLIVQEIRSYPNEGGSRASRLGAALGMTWAYAGAWNTDDGGTHGLAIFAKRPLDHVLVRDLPYIDQPIHPEQRIALSAEVDGLRIVDVHLDVRLGPVDRIRQLHPAVNDLGETLVAGGDFNTSPWAWIDSVVPLTGTEAVLDQDQAAVVDDYLFGIRFAGAIGPDTSTFNFPGLHMRIDNLYARGLPIVAGGLERIEGSDHFPVWFDVDRCQK